MRARSVVVFAFVASTTATADAHVGPHAEAQRLTREIDAAGARADGPRLLARATALRDEGELAEAEADLDAAEHASPPADRGLVALERARIAFDRRRDEDALAAYDEALRIERPPERERPGRLYAVILAERAATHERLGRWSDARADWDASFGAWPAPEAALARGRLDELLGDVGRAIDGYREAQSATPTIAVSHALCRALLRRGDAAEVIDLADEAMDDAPFDAEWLLLRADALDVAGSHEEAATDRAAALAEVDQAMRTRPNDLRRLVRARVWLALGRADDAAREAEDVARLRPTLGEAAELAREARAAKAGR